MIAAPKRPDPPPELAKGYDHPEVKKALVKDLGGKCYLCESVRRQLEVEHLRPKSAGGGRDDWGNLFLACNGSCNQRRIRWETKDNAEIVDGLPIRWPKGGMIDPGRDLDLEDRLLQIVVYDRHSIVPVVSFHAVSREDTAAVNTATELTTIHRGDQAEQLRADFATQMRFVQGTRVDWLIAMRADDVRAAEAARLALRVALGPKAPFTALVKSVVVSRIQGDPGCMRDLGLE